MTDRTTESDPRSPRLADFVPDEPTAAPEFARGRRATRLGDYTAAFLDGLTPRDAHVVKHVLQIPDPAGRPLRPREDWHELVDSRRLAEARDELRAALADGRTAAEGFGPACVAVAEAYEALAGTALHAASLAGEEHLHLAAYAIGKDFEVRGADALEVKYQQLVAWEVERRLFVAANGSVGRDDSGRFHLKTCYRPKKGRRGAPWRRAVIERLEDREGLGQIEIVARHYRGART